MPVTLEFIIGGGPHLTFEYRIRGGHFDGCRVELAPVRSAEALAYGRSIATDPKEWDRTYGPEVRPRVVKLTGRDRYLTGADALTALKLDPETLAAVDQELVGEVAHG